MTQGKEKAVFNKQLHVGLCEIFLGLISFSFFFIFLFGEEFEGELELNMNICDL